MSKNVLVKDRLFLLKPDFTDPEFPGRRFYCWHCALIEGVLTALSERHGFPQMHP